MKNNKALRFIANVSKKHIIKLCAITVLNGISAFLGVYFALVMRNVINFATSGNRDMAFREAALLAGVVLLQLLLFVVLKILAAHTTARLDIAFRESVFEKLLKKDYSSVSKYHTGEIQNRLFNDVSVVSDNVATLLPGVVGLITRLVGALCAILLVDTTFALVILCGGLVIFAFARAFRSVMKKTHTEVQESGGRLRSFIQESIANILVIKAFNMEESIEQEEDELATGVYKKKMRRAWFSTFASTGFSSIINIGYLYAVIWGAWKLLSGAAGFGYGDFVAIMQLISQIQAPFAGLSGSLSKYYSAIASAERLLELCDLPEDNKDASYNASSIYEKLSEISLCDVSFSYDSTPIFNSASVDIKKGTLTLISGISGIGKSTMIKMLMGVLNPQDGEIKAKLSDGEIPLSAATRGLFAYVPQGNMIMSGTIRKNMLFAKNDASDEEIFDALNVAAASFVSELPDGLDSHLGERGCGLSEGQIQRLAIARAVLCEAPILLLDEATSALDEATEKEVLENIMSLPGRTCVCISHRAAAASICDAEIYVENGKIFKKERENII